MFAVKIKLSKPLLVDMPWKITGLFTSTSLEICDETASAESAGLQHPAVFWQHFLWVNVLGLRCNLENGEEAVSFACTEKYVSALCVHPKEVTYHLVLHWPKIYLLYYKLIILLNFCYFEKKVQSLWKWKIKGGFLVVLYKTALCASGSGFYFTRCKKKKPPPFWHML